MPATKTPVTIITGFLGAGKTTLLNYILQERGNKNIAVIENEFGEINIDKELVSDKLLAQEDLVALDRGCICCSLRKDILRALAEIERRARQRGRRFDSIILETTGLADPAPVAFTFLANPWIASRFKLDSILCVVDARYLMQHLNDKHHEGTVNEAAQQVAFADVLLINKVDLVSSSDKENVIDAVRAINGAAKLIECQLNDPAKRPPAASLLDVELFSVNKALQVDPTLLDSESDDETITARPPADLAGPADRGSLDLPHKAAHRGDHCAAGPACSSPACEAAAGSKPGLPSSSAAAAADAEHIAPEPLPSQAKLSAKLAAKVAEAAAAEAPTDEEADDYHEQVLADTRPAKKRKAHHDLSGISSIGVTAVGPLDEYRFNMYMRDLLTEKAKDIFRCKGVLSVHGYGNQKFLFQGVHETICYGPSERAWADDEPRINKIVFIGRNLDRKAILEGLRTCVWTPLPDDWEEFNDDASGRSYYCNRVTREKTWQRPEAACARVTATSVPWLRPPSKTAGAQR